MKHLRTCIIKALTMQGSSAFNSHFSGKDERHSSDLHLCLFHDCDPRNLGGNSIAFFLMLNVLLKGKPKSELKGTPKISAL